jgi:hypothetical protein
MLIGVLSNVCSRQALCCAGGWSPLLSTHHLPTSLSSLSFEPCQYPNTQVYFGGRKARVCISVWSAAQNWRFLEHIPGGLTSLKLFSSGFGLVNAMQSLTCLTSLRQLDIYVGQTRSSDTPEGLVEALQAVPSLQGVGVHSGSDCYRNWLKQPYCGGEVRMTMNLISKELGWTPYMEDQMSEASRPRLSSLVIHFRGILFCPSLHGCSALRELVLAHCSRQFASVCPDHFSVRGLEAVAGTLTRLVLSSDRALTTIQLPQGLRLQSLLVVCLGTLAVYGDASSACIGLKEALLGYAEMSGDTAEFVFGLSSRLSRAELEVIGSQPLRQGLRYTHAALVGQWWHGVHQKSMASDRQGSLCCRVRVWRHGRLCPAHASFAQYGIISTHEDRDVRLNQHDNEYNVRPTWHPVLRASWQA